MGGASPGFHHERRDAEPSPRAHRGSRPACTDYSPCCDRGFSLAIVRSLRAFWKVPAGSRRRLAGQVVVPVVPTHPRHSACALCHVRPRLPGSRTHARLFDFRRNHVLAHRPSSAERHSHSLVQRDRASIASRCRPAPARGGARGAWAGGTGRHQRLRDRSSRGRLPRARRAGPHRDSCGCLPRPHPEHRDHMERSRSHARPPGARQPPLLQAGSG